LYGVCTYCTAVYTALAHCAVVLGHANGMATSTMVVAWEGTRCDDSSVLVSSWHPGRSQVSVFPSIFAGAGLLGCWAFTYFSSPAGAGLAAWPASQLAGSLLLCGFCLYSLIGCSQRCGLFTKPDYPPRVCRSLLRCSIFPETRTEDPGARLS